MENCCNDDQNPFGCCNIESVITVDDRGQMVLPKELRDKAKINAGDKLVVISCERDNEINGFFLLKSDEFNKMVKNYLSPEIKK